MNKYDLTYITIDSLSEGVGSSQISPLIWRLSKLGLKISLISFEKTIPDPALIDSFDSLGVEWKPIPFGENGPIGGAERFRILRREIPQTDLIHARSEIPAVSGIASGKAPVLWDVRSLWADQKIVNQPSRTNKMLYRSYRGIEYIAAHKSLGVSTLTNAVVPILEQRNGKLPELRAVVPTAVDLDRFQQSTTMPSHLRALFSGTFNDYYDLELSALFIREVRRIINVETHWARPYESERSQLGVGEDRIFPSSQQGMAKLIPNYSFGVAVCKLDAGLSLAGAMPTKIGEFLACGRPVVVNKGLGDMDGFIKEFNAGIIIDGDRNNLGEQAEKLVELVLDTDLPNRCRALAEKYFSMDIGSINYLDLYTRMKSRSQE